jgi:abortive infection Abi-like protein
MVEPLTAQARFQMVGARAAVLDGPIAEAIEQQIHAIENALSSVPDFAFDLSKTLVESVCKTVLADIGHTSDPNWDAPKLLKETTKRLALLPRSHPEPAKARDSVEKTIRGLLQTIQGLCELRNGYGMASHGRDGFSARLDLRQATLAAQAADAIVSFIYRVHRDALMQSPGARVYYEDHAAFNEAFDRENEPIRLGDVELLPSRVLFHGDREAYKAALNEYLAEQSGTGNGAAAAAPGAGGQEAP